MIRSSRRSRRSKEKIEKIEKRRKKEEGRREKGEGRREKGEGRREKGEGRREKGEGKGLFGQNLAETNKRKERKREENQTISEETAVGGMIMNAMKLFQLFPSEIGDVLGITSRIMFVRCAWKEELLDLSRKVIRKVSLFVSI